jgi:hypothetical protein
MTANNVESSFGQAWLFAASEVLDPPISFQSADFIRTQFNLFQSVGEHHGQGSTAQQSRSTKTKKGKGCGQGGSALQLNAEEGGERNAKGQAEELNCHLTK